MGMFDQIRCEPDLPGDPPEWVLKIQRSRLGFQTKSTDGLGRCYMRQFIITMDGDLALEVEVEGDGPPDLKFFSDFHGDIHFYELESDECHSVTGEAVSYRARFTEGKLSSLIETEDL